MSGSNTSILKVTVGERKKCQHFATKLCQTDVEATSSGYRNEICPPQFAQLSGGQIENVDLLRTLSDKPRRNEPNGHCGVYQGPVREQGSRPVGVRSSCSATADRTHRRPLIPYSVEWPKLALLQTLVCALQCLVRGRRCAGND